MSKKRSSPRLPSAPGVGSAESTDLPHQLGAVEDRLREALAERDAALLALAKERTLTSDLRLHLRAAGESEPPRYPLSSGVGPPPLRYVAVDRANDSLKVLLGPLHGGARRLADLIIKGRGAR